MQMTPDRWRATHEYLNEVFGEEDEVLRALCEAAGEAGLPDISVGPVVGRLLMMLASMLPPRDHGRGPTALEIGTLGGYSAIWIARGLGGAGRLMTVEIEPRHAAFARQWFDRAGLSDRIDLRQGAALDVLPAIANELGAGGLDMLFLDAEKAEYPEYWRICQPLIAPRGLVVIDNALGSNTWWIDVADHPARQGADDVNRAIAADRAFEAVAFPLRQGVMVARRVGCA